MNAPSTVQRLGTEKIGKLLLEMSSQTTLSLLVYAIYSVTDTFFLSVGINALAAAGASIISPVLLALGGVATTVGVGGASLVSRALGEANTEKASRTVANTFLIFWCAALAITVAGALFIRPLVFLLGATDSIAPYAIPYGRIIFLGALTSTGYSAIVRADGHVGYSTAMWMVPVSANIIFCWLFILVLHTGVSGAALATVLGQAISAGMSLYFFFFRKHRTYQIKASDFKPDGSIIAEILIIGFPSFVKGISASMVVIVTNNLLKLVGGDSALAVFAIVNRLYSALNTPKTGIMQGMQPILGYNFGQKSFGRVQKTMIYSLAAAVVYGLLVCGLCLLLPATLITLLSKEPAMIGEGEVALRLLALACPLGGMSVLVAAYFQAIGRAKEALLLTLGGIILVKLPVLWLASSLFSLTGIWSAEAVSESMLCIISLLLLRRYQQKMAVIEPLAYSRPTNRNRKGYRDGRSWR